MMNERETPSSCDIFCNIIDNYGDIGVCWRLAKLLVNEHGLAVRLWVDDLNSLAPLCHEVDATRDIQHCKSVEVRRWIADAFNPDNPLGQISHPPCRGKGRFGSNEQFGFNPLKQHISRKQESEVANLVIEAFSCKLPQSYIEAMAAQQQSVWINLEYLSAEDWVEGCHKLPSPHPNLPLTKYFFFPGFTKQTGGLLLENDLLARRDAFQNDTAQQQAFWQSIGMKMPSAETLKISLFSYENAALAELFDVWTNSGQPVLCLIPKGRILPQVKQYFENVGQDLSRSNRLVRVNSDLQGYSCGALQVRVLPFVEQEIYDELLWACDVNFVRGEDSCVRAQWAARPFVWQIYPQHDGAHWDKLQAFLGLYEVPLGVAASQAMQDMWQAWNSGIEAGLAWPAFAAARNELNRHAQDWAWQLAENNLALNLLDFCQKIGRIRAFEIEGQ